MHDFPILRDLAIIFAAAVIVVALLRRIGIPPIAGYIVAGAIVGPELLGLIAEPEQVELLAEVGIALLLFGIGLELSLDRLQRLWRPVLVGGALQVGITVVAVVLLGPVLKLSLVQLVFLGFILAVSSTAIVLRGLEGRGELDAPHGRLSLGILVFQDLCVVPAMLAIPLLAGGSSLGSWLWVVLLFTTVGLALVVLAAYWIVPRLLHIVAGIRQRDLFIMTALLVCIGTAWAATLAGVSLALGAFLAGLVVAGSDYRHQAMAELIPFREVLASLFFVSVGMLLHLTTIVSSWLFIILALLAIIAGKTILVLLVAWIMRLPLRVSVLAAISLAQVGEFSFVLYSAASDTPLLEFARSDALLVAIILSMVTTPVVMAQGPRLAEAAAHSAFLRRLFSRAPESLAGTEADPLQDHVIIAGWGVAGQELSESLKAAGIPYVIADLNADSVRDAIAAGESIVYGDISSAEVLHRLGIHQARMLVVVVNDPDAAERAVRVARDLAPGLTILVRARYVAHVESLFKAGATDVVPAELEAAVEVSARVLLACGADLDTVAHERARIRLRQTDDDAAHLEHK